MRPALIATSEWDAVRYINIYPALREAKVFMVNKEPMMQGFRPSAVHATPRAKGHAEFEAAYRTMWNNYVLCNPGKAPRIL